MKRMLADVLWSAANDCLHAGGDSSSFRRYQESCLAAKEAYCRTTGKNWEAGTDAEPLPFLQSLGCDWGGEVMCQIPADARQGVRYMWLLLAMHVAEDEGIEI